MAYLYFGINAANKTLEHCPRFCHLISCQAESRRRLPPGFSGIKQRLEARNLTRSGNDPRVRTSMTPAVMPAGARSQEQDQFHLKSSCYTIVTKSPRNSPVIWNRCGVEKDFPNR
ncbi:hypothetical protein IF1G_08969 [Cordyceps javanica]|uniref:Uncharacterized protein n=1 Tax=Cordyceps javanica TaxID=43265 RepID=A0A545USM2_9HYPO|nr:hypothetical protein IF1G_08969 [Cordyceps javanica]